MGGIDDEGPAGAHAFNQSTSRLSFLGFDISKMGILERLRVDVNLP